LSPGFGHWLCLSLLIFAIEWLEYIWLYMNILYYNYI
jgi:hypothetical protein